MIIFYNGKSGQVNFFPGGGKNNLFYTKNVMYSCEYHWIVPSNSLLCTYISTKTCMCCTFSRIACRTTKKILSNILSFFVLFFNYSEIFESCDGKIAHASCSMVICSLFPQISENRESMFLSVHCLNKKINECWEQSLISECWEKLLKNPGFQHVYLESDNKCRPKDTTKWMQQTVRVKTRPKDGYPAS